MDTSIIDVKNALVSTLTQALPEAKINYAFPGKYADSLGVYLSGTTGRQEIRAMRGGTKPRTEYFTIELIAYAQTGPTAADAEAAVLTLFNKIQQAVADDPTLGETLNQGGWLLFTDFDISEARQMDTGQKFLSLATLHIEVTSALT